MARKPVPAPAQPVDEDPAAPRFARVVAAILGLENYRKPSREGARFTFDLKSVAWRSPSEERAHSNLLTPRSSFSSALVVQAPCWPPRRAAVKALTMKHSECL